MCGCNLVTPRLIGGGGRSSAGSLAMLADRYEAQSALEAITGNLPLLLTCPCSGPLQQLRRLGDVSGEQLGRRAPPRLILGINVGERLPVGVADALMPSARRFPPP